MKEATSSTWTVQIIILFILIFACFLTLVLSYSKAYSIKNKMISVIEKYDGVNVDSAAVINNFISEHGYRTEGTCPTEEGWYGAKEVTSEPTDDSFEKSNESNGGKYYYCFKESEVNEDMIKYDIVVFYKFNLPVIGDIMTYKINGETMAIAKSNDRIGVEE